MRSASYLVASVEGELAGMLEEVQHAFKDSVPDFAQRNPAHGTLGKVTLAELFVTTCEAGDSF